MRTLLTEAWTNPAESGLVLDVAAGAVVAELIVFKEIGVLVEATRPVTLRVKE